MNRHQRIAVAIAAANLLVMLLFPPFDYRSLATAFPPAFAGFYFAFTPPAHGQLNTTLLTLEVMVVLVNAALAWWLLRDRASGADNSKLKLQNAVLITTGANLILMLLFPPFTTEYTLANPAPPTFEGFHFIFNQGPNQAIATGILYLEIIFILVNGGLFWLSFNEGL
ncbi:MAG TPA: hypothetical protein VKD25_02440 [Burkholderiales bacterium]|nr:hypothetical protein [Burkholderiales bacterium]